MTGCVVGRGRTAEEEEEDPCQVEGAAWGEHSEDEELEVHREGNEEGTSSLEAEGPTLETKQETQNKVYTNDVWR